MVFKKGDKVRVNERYGLDVIAEHGSDGSIEAFYGQEGKVTQDFEGHFVWVDLTVNGQTENYLFFPSELDLLEEAHPLQNEFTKS